VKSFSLPPRSLLEQQAGWLAAARARLLRKADIARRQCVVELAAGWGSATAELQRRSGGWVLALDGNLAAMRRARSNAASAAHLVCDARRLALADACCELVFVQCALGWINPPAAAIGEAVRILAPQGVLAAIEPDYGGMMEWPPEVATASLWQAGLARSGADPQIGRKLPALLSDAGLDVDVLLLDRLEPPADERFELLAGLDLTDAERSELDRIQRAAQDCPRAVVHLPFWLVLGTKRC
jgi:SAM-dependent methyltransferase